MSNNRSTKRLFAVALSLIMVLALLPVTALAATSISGYLVTVEGGPFTYTGSAITPTVTVKPDEMGGALTVDVDYTVGYEDNTNAGTATITVTGIGSYEGTASQTFIIKSKVTGVDPFEAVSVTAFEAKDCADPAAIAAIANLPDEADVTIEGNASTTDASLSVVWGNPTPSTISNKKEATYTFTGTLTGTDSIDINGNTAEITVNVTPVAAVNPTFADTTVPVGEDDEATAADLGASVLPTSGSITAAGQSIPYTVAWNAETLDLTTEGDEQIFTGTITYTDAASLYPWLTIPGDLSVSRKVTVENPAPVPPQVNLPHKPQVIAASGSSGVAVSGNLSQGATVTASEASLDTVGSNAGAQFVTALAGGEKTLLGITEVKINGTFSGKLSVTLPVDPQYNGQTVTVLHYTSAGKLETYTAVVVNGAVTVEVSSLSPFAVLIDSKLVNEDGPDLDEPTPDDDLPGEDEDDLDIEEDEDIVDDDIVEDVPGTGDGAVNAAWTVLVSTLVLGAAVAFVMKKKAADNR